MNKGKYHVKLSALEIEDVEFVFSMENCPENWVFGTSILPLSRYLIEQYILSESEKVLLACGQGRFIIRSTKDNKALGILDVFEYSPIHRHCMLGIIISEKYRKKGLAKEALEVFLDRAYQFWNIHQVYAEVKENNLKSRQLFESVGFQECGCKKEWYCESENYLDVFCYQKIIKNRV